MSERRTQRERIWRACLIQRTWRKADLAACTGIPLSLIGTIMRELQEVCAVERDQGTYRALMSDPRLPIRDPERGQIMSRVLECILEIGDGEPEDSDALAHRLGITIDQARHALQRLAARGLIRRTAPGHYGPPRASVREEVRDGD